MKRRQICLLCQGKVEDRQEWWNAGRSVSYLNERLKTDKSGETQARSYVKERLKTDKSGETQARSYVKERLKTDKSGETQARSYVKERLKTDKSGETQADRLLCQGKVEVRQEWWIIVTVSDYHCHSIWLSLSQYLTRSLSLYLTIIVTIFDYYYHGIWLALSQYLTIIITVSD